MKQIWTYWQWQPAMLIAVLLLCLLFARLWHFRRTKQVTPFGVALLLLVICLFSPIALLSQHYLFSAHMAVHVVLLLLVGPLLVLSMPEQLPTALARFFSFFSHHPWLTWLSGVGIMWLWHIPAVFNAMMHHSSHLHMVLHGVETFSLVVSGMVFSYPILAKRQKLHALTAIVYLFSACVFCSLLGLIITFAPTSAYSHYLSMADTYHLNAVIQNNWNISRQADQQAAGLIMWVPCCMIYVSASLYLLRQWFAEKEFRDTLSTFTKKSTL